MDMLDLYHRTSQEAAVAILSAFEMVSKENTQEAYFTTVRDGLASGYGDAVVHVRVPEALAELDDEFPSGEQHYRVKIRDLRPEHFVTDADPRHLGGLFTPDRDDDPYRSDQP